MKANKIFAIVLALAVVLSLASCGETATKKSEDKSEEVKTTVSEPVKTESSESTAVEPVEETSDAQVAEEPSIEEDVQPANESGDSELRADFKEAMDSYESFMDEYCEFMEKYSENSSDIAILTDYATYMAKYADMCAKFDKWESEDLNDAELAYYIDVQARVSEKLLNVADAA